MFNNNTTTNIYITMYNTTIYLIMYNTDIYPILCNPGSPVLVCQLHSGPQPAAALLQPAGRPPRAREEDAGREVLRHRLLEQR